MLRRQSRSIRAVAHDDATVVEHAAGRRAPSCVGLTNVPEMGRGGESNNNLYGRTNNPYDLSRTPGGDSSGGSAALVASGGRGARSSGFGRRAAASDSRATTPASRDSSPPTAESLGPAACSATRSVVFGAVQLLRPAGTLGAATLMTSLMPSAVV